MLKNFKKILAVVFIVVIMIGIIPMRNGSIFTVESQAAENYVIDSFSFRLLKASPETGNCVYNKIVITPYNSKLHDGKIEDGTWTFSLKDGNYINELVITSSYDFGNTPSGEGIKVDSSKRVLTYTGLPKESITIEHLATDSVYSITAVGVLVKHNTHKDANGNPETYTEFNLDTCVANNVIKPGKYYLSKNTAFPRELRVEKNTSVTICLNGYVLDASKETYSINNCGNLTITDCNDTRKHYFNIEEYEYLKDWQGYNRYKDLTERNTWTYYSDKIKTEHYVAGGIITGADDEPVIYCNKGSTTLIENVGFVGNSKELVEGEAANSITLKNCIATYNDRNVCRLRNCSTAISNGYKGELNVYDCVFEYNNGYMGTVINSDGPIVVTNSKFIDNWSVSGGSAIYSKKECKITDCEFTENKSQVNYGGAICVENGTLSVKGGSFTGNRASYGGAIGTTIYTDSRVTVTLNDVEFKNNKVCCDGGAIHSNRYQTKINATNCTFTGNSADENGGAINFANNGTLTTENCEFTNNTANKWGGAICSNTADLHLKNTKITNNTSVNELAGGVDIGEATLYLYGATVIKDNKGKNGVTYNLRLENRSKNIVVKEKSKDMCVGITLESYDSIKKSFISFKIIGKSYDSDNKYQSLFSDKSGYRILNADITDDNSRTFVMLPSATASVFGPVGIITISALLLFIVAFVVIVIYKKKQKKKIIESNEQSI